MVVPHHLLQKSLLLHFLTPNLPLLQLPQHPPLCLKNIPASLVLLQAIELSKRQVDLF
jgi:hypothetical protein